MCESNMRLVSQYTRSIGALSRFVLDVVILGVLSVIVPID